MSKRALVILADGFEEIEAVAPIDILRRAGIEVIVAGLGRNDIVGSRNIKILTDITLDEFQGGVDAVVLPGGSAGAENLAKSTRVASLLTDMRFNGGLIAAICAAPAVVLGPLGLLAGRKASCYPGMESRFPLEAEHVCQPVVADEDLVTANGAAAAVDFSLAIVRKLLGKEKAEEVGRQILA